MYVSVHPDVQKIQIGLAPHTFWGFLDYVFYDTNFFGKGGEKDFLDTLWTNLRTIIDGFVVGGGVLK